MTNPGTHPDDEAPGGSCGCCADDTDSAAAQPAGAGDSDAEAPAPEDAPGAAATNDSDADTDTADAADADTAAPPTVEEQLAERTDDLQRVTAEYANYRRRTDRDRNTVIATTKASVITDFLPALDDLDLAKAHGDLTGPLKAINDKLMAAFDKLGVTRIGEVGDQFNPELHEAVQDLSENDTKIIGTVLRPGYMLGERLVRTAMVIISDPVPAEGDN